VVKNKEKGEKIGVKIRKKKNAPVRSGTGGEDKELAENTCFYSLCLSALVA